MPILQDIGPDPALRTSCRPATRSTSRPRARGKRRQFAAPCERIGERGNLFGDMVVRVRLIELTAALSLATDAGTGQPFEHALRTALLSLRAADALGLSSADQSTALYTTLLRFVGCTSTASESAAMAGGDDIGFNATMAPFVMADDREALPHLIRHLGEGLPLGRRVGRVAAALSDPGGKARSLSAHCEVGARFAARLGLPADVVAGVGHAYERWDGKGLPDGLAGDAIPLGTRIAVVARDVDLAVAAGAGKDVRGLLKRRRGRAYDPAIVDAFLTSGPTWLTELEDLDPWDMVIDGEPDPALEVQDSGLDDALGAFADFADLKSPWFVGHSRAVSELAGRAALVAGLDEIAATTSRRAGLVHDLGIVGVPSGVWNRPGPLTRDGRERVRTHPAVGERILSSCAALEKLATVAGAHHERLDGSGYHRGSRPESFPTQLVAVADVYCAVQEDRPHRSAVGSKAAAGLLTAEVDAGRLPHEAIDAVLGAAGHATILPNIARPAGLTEREIDVLRFLARGRSNKEAARELGVSPKTVGTHVEHIYAKAGVTTRAGATVFAMEHNLLRA